MRFSTAAMAAVAAASTASAQRPNDTSICDYYTKALLKDNTAENQMTLLTLVVNTVVIGNYTEPNVGIKVPGILAPGKYMGKDVNLMPYFNGELASTNRGDEKGVSVNFLDGGGAEPLMKNMAANDKTSQQYFLLTHLYQFFGSLLGCSQQGMAGFAAYTAQASMYEVHKFMGLDEEETKYFISQVGLAAASFGVADADVAAVGAALTDLFGYRCAAPAVAVPAQGPHQQSICIASSCPVALNNTMCDAYPPAIPPINATASSSSSSPAGPNGTMSGGGGGGPMATPSSTMPVTAGAGAYGINLAVIAVGLTALLV